MNLAQPCCAWLAALAFSASGCGRLSYVAVPQDVALAGFDANQDTGPLVDAFFFRDVTVDAGPRVPTFGIRSGIDHSCALLRGALACVGTNNEGQLGLGDVAARAVLTPVEAHPWVDVAAGYSATCARTYFGEVFCFGANNEGQLGVGDTTRRTLPVQVQLPEPIAQLSLAFDHACVIQHNGALHCWGANFEGQLGQDDEEPGVIAHAPVAVAPALTFTNVSAGQGHTCAVASGGALYCWGRNTSCELGLVPAVRQLRVPTRIGTARYRSVAAGQSQTCAITLEGRLACWGADEDADGDAGPGGLASSSLIAAPTQIDARTGWSEVSTDTFHTCAIFSDGTLHCWGRNREGQLGLGDSSIQHQTPTQVGTDTDWIHIGVGRFYTCAQKRDASVWCTGSLPMMPSDGQMNRSTFIQI